MNKFIMYTILIIFVIGLSYGLAKTRQSREAEVKNPPPASESKSLEKETNNQKNVSEIDIQKSIVRWSAKKTLVTTNNHTGTINLKNGFISIKEGVVEKGELILDMQTIASTDLSGAMKSKLEEHLKSEDFFAVNKFPTAKFTIKKSIQKNDNQIELIGDLTIKDITHEISFPATFEKRGDSLSIRAELEIDRTLWDIRFGSGKFFDNLGNNIIDDIIKMSLEISN